MELTEPQLETLLMVYTYSHDGSVNPWFYCATRRRSAVSVGLGKLGLVQRRRSDIGLHMKITRRGSRLLATDYPLETAHHLALTALRRVGRTAELRRAMQRMLSQLPPEQFPELLTHENASIRELATKLFEELKNG